MYAFFDLELAIFNVANKSIHIQMKSWIVPLNIPKELVDCNFGIQFFFDFSDEGLFWNFSDFDFSTGKLPFFL